MTGKNDKAIKIDSNLQELFDFEQWSSAACRGYAIKACESVGLDHKIIIQVVKAFGRAFDEYTVEQAEQIFYNF